MLNTKREFSPSINILRDAEKDFEYIVTPNAADIYEQIVSNFDTGVHSFSIIGSYGTGKSAFLVAFMKTLKGEKNIFKPLNGELKNINGVEFDLILGKYNSLVKNVAEHFGLSPDSTEEEILIAISKKHDEIKSEGKYWFIIFDEFGKYLEYAAKHNPDKELYFIQLLAEFANEESKNLYLINTLHQAFDSYAFGLDSQQRKEWDKVKGRLKELAFNEPVEQLVHIASKHLDSVDNKLSDKDFGEVLSIITESQAYPLKSKLNKRLAKSLFPMEPLSAATLAIALQKYGQNERSLFSFLKSEGQYGINAFDDNGENFYGLPNIYDYLLFNHHSFLSSKYNPHYVQWNALKNAINRAESHFTTNIEDYLKIVKTIGLLNIFANAGAVINSTFLEEYGEAVLGISLTKPLIEDLEAAKILRFRSFKNQFILFEGTDYDIEYELQNVSQKVELPDNIVPYLKQHFELPFLPAKRAFYRTGTPRYFEFILTENPLTDRVVQPIDGIINLVFGASSDDVKSISSEVEEPVLYGVFRNIEKLRKIIFEIHKVGYLIKSIESDKVAEKELKALRNSNIENLNRAIEHGIYSDSNEVEWIYRGNSIDLHGRKDLNQFLSKIAEEVYNQSPIYKNELINKHKVSPAVYRPRKELLKRVMEHRNDPLLGFDEDTFPAEKTIYLSLLNQPGLHREIDGVWDFYPPELDSSLINLWNTCEEFFESSKSGKRPLTDLVKILEKPPVGLKNGFIEIWLPIYLIMKDGNYALFQEEAYIPELTYDVVNLVYRSPKLFEIKAYQISDVKKRLFSKYRELQNQTDEDGFSNKTFIETIRPFLLTYNDLNEYGRKTNTISASAIKLREAIKTATDPEKVFFDEFPQALGYHSLDDLKSDEAIQQFIFELDKNIEEIKKSYQYLLDKIERCLLDALDFSKDLQFKNYIEQIRNRYNNIQEFKLIDRQRKLLNRMHSPLEDREKWLNSVGLAVLDKPLSKLKDEEEDMLFNRLQSRVQELDALIDLSKEKIDQEKDEAFRLQLYPLSRTPIEENIKVKKSFIVEQSDNLNDIKSRLTGNKKKDLAILSKLIEDIIEDE